MREVRRQIVVDVTLPDGGDVDDRMDRLVQQIIAVSPLIDNADWD